MHRMAETSTKTIVIRRAGERFHTQLDWLDSWHSFNFNHFYSPDDAGHGLLVVNNDDVVRAGTGFGTHGHRDMEIVTWVLEGELEHRDSIGTRDVIYPGLAQRMSAGRGITHSETNPSATTDVHLIQMWVRPDTAGIEPSYEQRDLNATLDAGGLVAVASGAGHDGAVAIHQRDAVLWVARLEPGEQVTVPDGPHVHVFVARGGADAQDAGSLATGDAARLTRAGELALTASDGGAEVLIWQTA
jgi:quercetin 2,3-dioxygenase